MVNTDFLETDNVDYTDNTDNEAPYRTFGLGLAARSAGRLSMRREHR